MAPDGERELLILPGVLQGDTLSYSIFACDWAQFCPTNGLKKKKKKASFSTS